MKSLTGQETMVYLALGAAFSTNYTDSMTLIDIKSIIYSYDHRHKEESAGHTTSRAPKVGARDVPMRKAQQDISFRPPGYLKVNRSMTPMYHQLTSSMVIA